MGLACDVLHILDISHEIKVSGKLDAPVSLSVGL
jgi:hypothetical protein